MQKKISLSLLLSAATCLSASDYTFVDLNSPWHFGNELEITPKGHPWHFDTDIGTIGEAKVTTHGKAKGTHIRNSSAFASFYYSHFLNQNNALSWQLAYNFVRFDWDHNPRFSQKDFHYGVASLAWISHSMEDWRWVVMAGLTANLQMLGDFGKSAVGYSLVWGRYAYELTFGLHVGFFGYAGAQNGLLLPIFGADWTISDKWKLTAVMPLDLSLDYIFTERWYASLSYTTFGGPYRFPWRYKGGTERYKDGIFKFYSKGLDLSLNYTYETTFQARIAGGYNFGGWALIKDRHDRHAKYYKYNGAPYGIAELSVTF